MIKFDTARKFRSGGIAAFITAALTLTVFTVGCGKEKPADTRTPQLLSKADEQRSFRASDFVDKTFAILSGSSFDAVARETIGATLCKYYDTPVKAIEAVKNGEADATLMEEPVARKFAAQNDDLIALYPPVDIENYAPIFPKSDNGKLRDEFNELLTKIRSDGTYEDMVKRWVDSPKAPPMPQIELNPTKKKLVLATSDCDEPFSFKTADGSIEGFDVEMALRFAQSGGYGLEVKVMEFPDIIPAVRAGTVDFASNLITITDERKAFIDFSEPVYYGGTIVVTRK